MNVIFILLPYVESLNTQTLVHFTNHDMAYSTE